MSDQEETQSSAIESTLVDQGAILDKHLEISVPNGFLRVTVGRMPGGRDRMVEIGLKGDDSSHCFWAWQLAINHPKVLDQLHEVAELCGLEPSEIRRQVETALDY